MGQSQTAKVYYNTSRKFLVKNLDSFRDNIMRKLLKCNFFEHIYFTECHFLLGVLENITYLNIHISPILELPVSFFCEIPLKRSKKLNFEINSHLLAIFSIFCRNLTYSNFF